MSATVACLTPLTELSEFLLFVSLFWSHKVILLGKMYLLNGGEMKFFALLLDSLGQNA